MDLEKGRVARQPVKKFFYVLANITRYEKRMEKMKSSKLPLAVQHVCTIFLRLIVIWGGSAESSR